MRAALSVDGRGIHRALFRTSEAHIWLRPVLQEITDGRRTMNASDTAVANDMGQFGQTPPDRPFAHSDQECELFNRDEISLSNNFEPLADRWHKPASGASDERRAESKRHSTPLDAYGGIIRQVTESIRLRIGDFGLPAG
jgi:hypothetical protein